MVNGGWLEKLRQVWSEPWYPLLFAVYPIIFLYQHNIKELTASVMVVPLAVDVAVVCLLLLVIYGLTRRRLLAAFVVFGLVVMFFSFGYLAGLFPESSWHVASFTIGGNEIVMGLWLVVIGLVIWLLSRFAIRWLGLIVQPLNLCAVILLALIIIPIVPIEVSRARAGQLESVVSSIKTIKSESKLGYEPDIYYIILDRYAGQKTLSEMYHFDNSLFLTELQSKGFYIATDSHTNYPSTSFSIAASLNMDYHQKYKDSQYSDVATYLNPKLAYPEVAKILKQSGYAFYQIGSTYRPTRKSDIADEVFLPPNSTFAGLGKFQDTLLSTTLLRPIASKLFPHMATFDNFDRHIQAVQYQTKQIGVVSRLPGPKLVFMHVLMPHDPYVVDENCQSVGRANFTNTDGVDRYLEQLQCANKVAEAAVQAVWQQSEGKAIMIIQADEGPHVMVNKLPDNMSFEDASDGAIVERTRILNAYYFPDRDYSNLYSTITPVNSFRVVLSQYFGQHLTSLPDKTFLFPSAANAFDFIDTTDRIRAIEQSN